MKTLVVEDDFVARKILQKMLSPFGQCDIAINGVEALEAFDLAHSESEPYDLICLDIRMPELDGHAALKELRNRESERGILGLDGVKIVMTTGLDDKESILSAFREGCEAYITKPIEREKLFAKLSSMGLIQKEES
jgi:two-component system chemotaxis response regulator CheY